MNLKFGVPCSRIKDKIKDVDVFCTSESEAMGISAGCILAGKEPIVYMQNSGLGAIIDICTSLFNPYKIPYPHMILSVRHHPAHHSEIGYLTYDILDMLSYEDVETIEQCEE
jgi:sulfopyruvate decarboxylase TPP-binding subunit